MGQGVHRRIAIVDLIQSAVADQPVTVEVGKDITLFEERELSSPF